MLLQRVLAAGLVGIVLAFPAQAQQAPKAVGCAMAAKPATQPAPASADGTSPGNAGSTGWTGGLGGSTVGTSQNGATAPSPTAQPVTARGLDPIAAAPRPVSAEGAPSGC